MKDLKVARHRYGVHKAGSKARNIDFNLTFEEWYSWWIENGVDKNIPNSSLSGDQPCMSRNGDTGPYSLDNIYYSTRRENVIYSRKNRYYNNGTSKCKKIKTPLGIFESRKRASEILKVSPGRVSHLVKTKPEEYYYTS